MAGAASTKKANGSLLWNSKLSGRPWEAPDPSAWDSWFSDRDYAYDGRCRAFGHRKQHECAGKTRRSDLSRRLTRRMTYSWERLATSRGSKQPRARVKWNVP